jgi:hypothetical protein
MTSSNHGTQAMRPVRFEAEVSPIMEGVYVSHDALERSQEIPVFLCWIATAGRVPVPAASASQ